MIDPTSSEKLQASALDPEFDSHSQNEKEARKQDQDIISKHQERKQEVAAPLIPYQLSTTSQQERTQEVVALSINDQRFLCSI